MGMSMNNHSPLLKAIGLRKSYGNAKALDNINFHIDEGEIVGIIGSNSAGKSVLSDILSGNTLPDSGKIMLNDLEVCFTNPTTARKLGIEAVHQKNVFSKNQDLLSNMFLGRELFKNVFGLTFLDQKKMRRIAKVNLELLGINFPLNSNLNLMSAGELQLLNFSRCLLQSSEVAIFDSTTSHLNPVQANNVLTIIRQSIADRLYKSVLFITHNIQEVLSLCDRIIVLRQGEIIMDRIVTETSREKLITLVSGDTKTQEANLNTIMNSIGDAVIASDTDNRIMRMNPIAEKLTGHSLSESKGRDIYILLSI